MNTEKGYSILSGDKITVVSEHGRTGHGCDKMLDAVAKHLYMLQQSKAIEIRVYDRATKKAFRYENVVFTLEPLKMTWEHTYDHEYAKLQDEKEG